MKQFHRFSLLIMVTIAVVSFLSFAQHAGDGAEEGVTERSEIDPNKRTLLVFLDNSEPYVEPYQGSDDKESEVKENASPMDARQLPENKNEDEEREKWNCYSTEGAISDDCLAAIATRSSPIIVSGSILYNLLVLPHEDVEKEGEDFTKAVRRALDLSDWVIKKVKQRNGQITELYCLMTRDYLAEQEKKSGSVKTSGGVGSGSGFTSLEYQLGLQFDQMEPVVVQNIKELRTYFKKKYDTYTQENFEPLYKNTGTDFLNYLNDIFVLNADYAKNDLKAPERSIYISGHGNQGESIIQLTFDQFSTLLDFLEKKIKTIFFIYASCYSAGYNAQQVYGELTRKGSAKTYPFAIATQAIAEVMTMAACNGLENGMITVNLHYDLFVNALLQSVISYKDALGYVMPQVKNPKWITDIPQIRFPHVPAWFPVTEIDKAIILITKTMSKVRQNPLEIKTYDVDGQEKNPRAILLYAFQVSFPVYINTTRMPVLVSMGSGKISHKIKDLNAPRITIRNFLKSFSNIEYGVAKDFFIKKAEMKDGRFADLLIQYRPSTQGDKPYVIKFFYTQYDKKNDSSKQKGGVMEGPDYELSIVEKSYTVPERYSSFAWQQPFTIDRYSGKKSKIPAIVERSRAQYAVKHNLVRWSKVSQLIKSLFLSPQFGYADRRGFRFLLQKLEKNDPKALPYFARIIHALGDSKIDHAIQLINQAYGKSKSIGFDFTAQDFYQYRWQALLLPFMSNELFDFLDVYTLKK